MLRIYRLALLLLPPAFRREYGGSLADAAAGRLAEARGLAARWRAVAHLVGDLAVTVLREWWDALTYETNLGMGVGMMMDLRWALRALMRTPGFTVTAVVTLALGIGASTVALGLVDAFLLRALPYPDSERLVAVFPEENWSRQMVREGEEAFPSLEGLAALGGVRLVLDEGGEPQEVFATQATTNLFQVLGVRPALGRDFLLSDGVAGAEPVTILSHRVWAERFGSDPDIVGRSVALGGEGHLRRTVVGVMAEDFLPLQGDAVAGWVPVVIDATVSDFSDDYFMRGIGRLATGAELKGVQNELRGFTERMGTLQREWFTEERTRVASVLPLARERASRSQTPVLAALGAALLVLLVACANLASLVVARTAGRDRELAVRAAIGAGRLRSAGTVLTELLVVAGAGTAGGLVLAWGLVRVLEARFPGAIPRTGLAVDLRWVGAAVALALLASMVAGLVPGIQAGRRDPARAMAGGRGSTGARGMNRFQEFLSATQLAMAMAGIAAMVLLGRSLLALNAVDPGFATENRISFRVTAPPTAYPGDADVVAFFRDARRALADVPGVTVVGFGSRLPLAGGDSRISVSPEGWDLQEGDPSPIAWHRLATPGYLEALGVRLVEGRIPDVSDDVDDTPKLVVINRAAAQRFWPDESAVGKRFYGPGGTVWVTVAGVVDDVMENGQTRAVIPGLYLPHRDWPWRTLYAVAQTQEDPAKLLPELKQAIWSVSVGVPISRVSTLSQVRESGLSATRTLTLLAALAGGVTLLLGALGVYGVVSHAVVRRLREIGVRAALGADRRQLLMGELGRATRILAWGVPAGLALAWLAGRGLRGVLYQVSPLDVPSVVVAALALAAVTYLAALLPARRAAAVDPVRIMREE